MSVKDVRNQLGGMLAESLGKSWVVFPEPGSLDDPQKPTLQLIRIRVERLPEAPIGAHLQTFALWLVAPQHTSEDALDGYLDDLTDALDDLRIRWTGADRDLFGDSQLPAYRVGITTPSTRKADS